MLQRCVFYVVGGANRDIFDHCAPASFKFFGVYVTLTYELMMVVVSLAVLKSGSVNIPRRHEMFGHFACVAAGVAGFLVNFSHCRNANEGEKLWARALNEIFRSSRRCAPLRLPDRHKPRPRSIVAC